MTGKMWISDPCFQPSLASPFMAFWIGSDRLDMFVRRLGWARLGRAVRCPPPQDDVKICHQAVQRFWSAQHWYQNRCTNHAPGPKYRQPTASLFGAMRPWDGHRALWSEQGCFVTWALGPHREILLIARFHPVQTEEPAHRQTPWARTTSYNHCVLYKACYERRSRGISWATHLAMGKFIRIPYPGAQLVRNADTPRTLFGWLTTWAAARHHLVETWRVDFCWMMLDATVLANTSGTAKLWQRSKWIHNRPINQLHPRVLLT